MKMKLKIALFFFLGLTIIQAQTKKKDPEKKATTTTIVAAKPEFTTSKPGAPALDTKEGIFAEIETSKGKIYIKLEYQKRQLL